MLAPNYFAKFLALGSSLLALGLAAHYSLPPLISRYIDTKIALTPTSHSFPLWREPPVPIYQRFYFFNVSNAQEIEQRGQKPQLEQVGPFTYRSEWAKRELERDEQRNTISFKHVKRWHFEPELSVADHKMQLVTLNAPLAITLTLIQSASSAVRLLVTFSLDGLSDGFFTKRSVKQLLFDGYPDLLTTFGPLLNAEMLSQGGHFGYMNARNNSQDGAYEVNTGADQISKLNTINRFNGRTKLAYWQNQPPSCNSLDGATPGDLFPPIAHNATTIKLFQPDFCRVWRLDSAAKLERESGLRVRRFKASRDIFRNSSDLPENSCFFAGRRQHEQGPSAHTNRVHDGSRPPSRQGRNRPSQSAPEEQPAAGSGGGNSNNNNNNNRHHSHNRVRREWPAGVFTLAPCKFNAPIYMSMPHFLDADPYFLAQVEGLEPEASKHEFYLDVEPRTGSPVSLAARVQLNVAISKPPGLVRFRNVPEIMFPVFWQELSVNLTGPVIDQLVLASRGAQEAAQHIAYTLLLLGAAVLITTALFYLQAKLAALTGPKQLQDS